MEYRGVGIVGGCDGVGWMGCDFIGCNRDSCDGWL